MRIAFPLLAVALLAAACGHSDSEDAPTADDISGNDPAITGADASITPPPAKKPAPPPAATSDAGTASDAAPAADAGAPPLGACTSQEDEPNGAAIFADALDAGDIICGTLSSSNDADWFQIQTTKAWTLRFESKDASITVHGAGAQQKGSGDATFTGGAGIFGIEIRGNAQSYKIAR